MRLTGPGRALGRRSPCLSIKLPTESAQTSCKISGITGHQNITIPVGIFFFLLKRIFPLFIIFFNLAQNGINYSITHLDTKKMIQEGTELPGRLTIMSPAAATKPPPPAHRGSLPHFGRQALPPQNATARKSCGRRHGQYRKTSIAFWAASTRACSNALLRSPWHSTSILGEDEATRRWRDGHANDMKGTSTEFYSFFYYYFGAGAFTKRGGTTHVCCCVKSG